MQINYEEFERHLKDVISITELSNDIYELGRKYYRENRVGDFSWEFPDLTYNVVELLEKLTNDKCGWIEYWVYELECGKKAEEYGVKDEAGNQIPLTSISDLWNILVAENER